MDGGAVLDVVARGGEREEGAADFVGDGSIDGVVVID